MNRIIYVFLLGLLASCSTVKKSAEKQSVYAVQQDSMTLLDHSRNRAIPVATYKPQTDKIIKDQKLVIISHGYYANMPGANKAYSYLSEFLASNGYFVVSIQHELPTDSLIPSSGIPQIVRLPFWECGAKNILFVLNQFKTLYPQLDYKHLILIGHSNGGDMSMLFVQEHPTLVDKIISLDNRRVKFPRIKHPKIYSLRSSDQPADDGVLPTEEERKTFDIKIIKLKNTMHSNMDNSGNEAQKREIQNYVLTFLND